MAVVIAMRPDGEVMWYASEPVVGGNQAEAAVASMKAKLKTDLAQQGPDNQKDRPAFAALNGR